jgi:hypothetical protein
MSRVPTALIVGELPAASAVNLPGPVSTEAAMKIISQAEPVHPVQPAALRAQSSTIVHAQPAHKASVRVMPARVTETRQARHRAVRTHAADHHFTVSLRVIESMFGTRTALIREQNRERVRNASIIIEVGKRRGLRDHTIAIAIATSIQESNLINVNWGDRDSLGLFQQRPSQGWGTRRQVTDPVYAADTFYDRLLQIPGYESMSMMRAAARVQIPNMADYESRWHWDAIATAIVRSYA